MVVQRIYETDLDMETVGAEVLRNQRDFKFIGESTLLSFRLNGLSENLLQLSPRKHFLMLHGLKPYEFLRDLRITKELAKRLSSIYPSGISFKLYKEKIPSHDMAVMRSREEQLSMFLMRSQKSRRSLVNREAGMTENSEELRGELAEQLNNAFAGLVCWNGFSWKPNGSIEPNPMNPLYQNKRGFRDLIENHLRLLMQSGYLE